MAPGGIKLGVEFDLGFTEELVEEITCLRRS